MPKLKRTTMALRWEVSNFLGRVELRLENPIGNDALARRGYRGSWWLMCCSCRGVAQLYST